MFNNGSVFFGSATIPPAAPGTVTSAGKGLQVFGNEVELGIEAGDIPGVDFPITTDRWIQLQASLGFTLDMNDVTATALQLNAQGITLYNNTSPGLTASFNLFNGIAGNVSKPANLVVFDMLNNNLFFVYAANDGVFYMSSRPSLFPTIASNCLLHLKGKNGGSQFQGINLDMGVKTFVGDNNALNAYAEISANGQRLAIRVGNQLSETIGFATVISVSGPNDVQHGVNQSFIEAQPETGTDATVLNLVSRGNNNASEIVMRVFTTDVMNFLRTGINAFVALTLKAGSTTAAPLLFTSGPLLSSVVAGAMEFLNDKLYFTTTTGPTRKEVVLASAALPPARLVLTDATGGVTTSGGIAYGGNEVLIFGSVRSRLYIQGNVPLTTTNTRAFSINSGATGTEVFTLIAGQVGLDFYFATVENFTIEIHLTPGDTLLYKGANIGTMLSLDADPGGNYAGYSIRLVCYEANKWIAVAIVGDWSGI